MLLCIIVLNLILTAHEFDNTQTYQYQPVVIHQSIANIQINLNLIVNLICNFQKDTEHNFYKPMSLLEHH